MKDPNAMYALRYGLFVLTARQGDKDNGCIINTGMQMTVDPNRIIITVNKQNYTEGIIEAAGHFALVPLTREADMPFIGRFGFRTGANFAKFASASGPARTSRSTPETIRSARCSAIRM